MTQTEYARASGLTKGRVSQLVKAGMPLTSKEAADEWRGMSAQKRAALASSKDPCAYCQLPKDEMTKCRSGFPGCARADDLMGCPELGAALEVERLERELTEAKIGAARYEYLRKLNPRQFSDLVMFCNTRGIAFDAEVDRRRNQT